MAITLSQEIAVKELTNLFKAYFKCTQNKLIIVVPTCRGDVVFRPNYFTNDAIITLKPISEKVKN